MNEYPSRDPGRAQRVSELRAASSTVWKCMLAILAGIACSGDISYHSLPTIFLLLWATVKKQCEIAVEMSELLNPKRKRTEDGSEAEELENRPLKKQREAGNFDASDQKSTFPHDLDQEHSRNAPNVDSLRSILVRNISGAQTALEIAQSELEKWDANHQQPTATTPSTPDAAEDDEVEEDGLENGKESHENEEEKDGGDDENEEEDDEDEDEDELWNFKEVLASIRLDKLPELASKLRQNLQLKDSQNRDGATPPDLVECVVQEKPLAGSFNILFVIEFADGIKWLLKVPESATVENFDQFAANRMESEVCTIRLIKSKTTIPLPSIYAHDITFDNAINCPYVMMEMLEGSELFYSWFDEDASEEELEQRRARTLKDLAQMMNQLGQFQFNEGGSLLFDGNGNPSGIGSLAIKDDYPGLLIQNDGEDYGKMREVGPFSDPVKFFTRKLDLHEPAPSEYSRATNCLLRLFISLLPQGPDPKFVLKHPDYDSQNILVAADGSVTGIIDWDKVRVAPRSSGNEAYPLWLMADYDPAHLVHEAHRKQNTTQELVRYRRMYLNFLSESKSDTESAQPNTANMTKVSLLANCLDYASCRVADADEVLSKILRELTIVAAHDSRAPEEAKDITVPLIGFLTGEEEEPQKVAMSLAYQIGLRIDQGTITDDEMGWLRDGFAALCSS